MKNRVTHDQNDDMHKLKVLAFILASSEIYFMPHIFLDLCQFVKRYGQTVSLGPGQYNA